MPRNPGMPQGRPPKPIEQHRMLGNPSKKKLPDAVITLPGVGSVPEPPEGLEDRGLRMWDDCWRWGAPWLSAAMDPVSVERVCRLADECARLDKLAAVPMVREPIITPSGLLVRDDDGKPMYHWAPNPACKLLRSAEVALRGFLADLGFSPTARARMGLAQVKAQSKLEEMLANARDARMAPKVVDTTSS